MLPRAMLLEVNDIVSRSRTFHIVFLIQNVDMLVVTNVRFEFNYLPFVEQGLMALVYIRLRAFS